MSEFFDVRILPADVHTVTQGLEALRELKTHAFAVLDRKKPVLIHARDLLRARKDNVESIRAVRGEAMDPMSPKLTGRLGKHAGFENLSYGMLPGDMRGDVDDAFGATKSDFLLCNTDKKTATVLSRREDFAYGMQREACICNGPRRHLEDNPPASQGKNCECVGCDGTYDCY